MRVSHQLDQQSPDHSTDHFADLLAEAEQTRRNQLAGLPPDTSLVSAAHRASVTRILNSILAAQARLNAGTYGLCDDCKHEIDNRSLRARPWTTLCDPCIRR
ncbi:hypothetical protein ASE01_20515 [Nocardioides sp. Root190]|uniref:TraR/DksA family transcriptional regulator n=1 Tax=Nocardioides sp. Root190 TaxID=1736488 RepID=UPI0006FA3C85|nr:TraR/DksA C4-type zinc finger protein [Nocardioides sp. Root190]KRB73151.1 hypothetical protein ASE01_20515 [Nocardioides sp. Root190]